MQNIKIVLAYDGSCFLGWQKSREGPTIEQSLQDVLTKILQHSVTLQAASRTDAKVHASRQVVNFFTPRSIHPFSLQQSMNCLLPKEMVVLSIEKMAFSFHPTLDCILKEYRYFICHGSFQLPFHRFYSWHYHYPLDMQAMELAAANFIGTHDFTSFCNKDSHHRYSSYERTLQELNIKKMEGQRVMIQVKGKSFLYKMVRNLVGTLAYVGSGKIAATSVKDILQQKDRRNAGPTAPAHGLFLHQITY